MYARLKRCRFIAMHTVSNFEFCKRQVTLYKLLIKLLPGPPSTIPSDNGSNYFGAKINDAGVICAAAGIGMFVYTPTDEGAYTWENLWDTFDISIPARQVAINNAGMIAGWYSSGTSSNTTWTAFRITSNANVHTFEPFSGYEVNCFTNATCVLDE